MKTRKMKMWEKIFVISSIVAIVLISGFYAYRLIKYYKEEHAVSFETVQKLKDVLTKDNNIIYSGEGLIKESDNLYTYKGKNTNNYLSYAGIDWRILKVSDEGIRLVSNEVISSIKADSNDINYFLNMTLKSIPNYESFLVKTNYSVDSFDLNNVTNEKNNNEYIGLLSFNEYVNAYGKDSFINNGTYFYLSNSDLNNNRYYVYQEGGVKTSDNQSLFGVRIVITLSNEVMYASGDGSKDNPYLLKLPENLLLSSKGVGSYIKINENIYRIIDSLNDSIRLISHEPLENTFNYDEAIEAINNYNQNIDQNIFVKCDFYNGQYLKNYQNIFDQKYNTYASMPSIADSFITSYDDTWLINDSGIEDAKYITKKDGRLYLESTLEHHYVRPVVCISKNQSVSGNGTLLDPYILGGN